LSIVPVKFQSVSHQDKRLIDIKLSNIVQPTFLAYHMQSRTHLIELPTLLGLKSDEICIVSALFIVSKGHKFSFYQRIVVVHISDRIVEEFTSWRKQLRFESYMRHIAVDVVYSNCSIPYDDKTVSTHLVVHVAELEFENLVSTCVGVVVVG
jgi:hypothetical protein